MRIGDRIKYLRTSKHYRQKDLANLLHVKPTTVSAWELGRNDPNVELLGKIAKVFNVSLAYLVGDTDDPKVKDKKTDIAENPDALDLLSYHGYNIPDEYKRAFRAMLEAHFNNKDK